MTRRSSRRHDASPRFRRRSKPWWAAVALCVAVIAVVYVVNK